MMGFKCPVFLKDFGKDQVGWKAHCAEKHLGAGKDIVEFLKKTAEEPRKEKT